MQAIKLKCNSRNRFRLGKIDIGHTTDWLHSDTLFSALVNAYLYLYGETQTNLLIYKFHQRKICISSAFYLVEILKDKAVHQRIFFLPKPTGRIYSQNCKDDDGSLNKRVKKIQFLSKDVFCDVLNSAVEEIDGSGIYFDIDLTAFPNLKDRFAISENEAKILKQNGFEDYQDIEPYYRIEMPKVSFVSIRSENSETGPFYETDLKLHFEQRGKYEWQTHFYFLIEHSLNESEETRLLAALRLLSDEGIGGERSTGAGWFVGIEILDFRWDLKGKYSTNVSLLSPIEEQDKLNSILSYESIIRGGWIYWGKGTGIQKSNVRMIREGSVFSQNFNGCLVQINKFFDKPVYQNGICFALNFGEKI